LSLPTSKTLSISDDESIPEIETIMHRCIKLNFLLINISLKV
jgi:hypothetical protein